MKIMRIIPAFRAAKGVYRQARADSKKREEDEVLELESAAAKEKWKAEAPARHLLELEQKILEKKRKADEARLKIYESPRDKNRYCGWRYRTGRIGVCIEWNYKNYEGNRPLRSEIVAFSTFKAESCSAAIDHVLKSTDHLYLKGVNGCECCAKGMCESHDSDARYDWRYEGGVSLSDAIGYEEKAVRNQESQEKFDAEWATKSRLQRAGFHIIGYGVPLAFFTFVIWLFTL